MSNPLQSIPKPVAEQPLVDLPIKISRYDRVAAGLISLLVLIGGAVGVMLVVWLTTQRVLVPHRIEFVAKVAGLGGNEVGTTQDLEAPGEEDMPELLQPQVKTGLEGVTVAVSSVAASMDVFDTASLTTRNEMNNCSDLRPRGPEHVDIIIPRWERWEVRYASNSLSAYAQQLDFFKIELGVVGGSRNVDYAANLSKSRPDVRQGSSQDEKRFYMSWKSGTLKQFDRQLLGRAGIANSGRLVIQFYPAETEEMLAWIEQENAGKQGHHNVKEFLRTIFAVRPAGRSFEFYVVEQRFRPAPP